MFGIFEALASGRTSGAGAVTPQDLIAASEALKRRDDLERRYPRGPCGCSMTLVGPGTEALLRLRGGEARCTNCGNIFSVPPPQTPPAAS